MPYGRAYIKNSFTFQLNNQVEFGIMESTCCECIPGSKPLPKLRELQYLYNKTKYFNCNWAITISGFRQIETTQ
jgi:hypothetical protein